MLIDVFLKGGFNVFKLEGLVVEELKSKFFFGVFVGNLIDILVIGIFEYLSIVIDYCEEKFENIDVIFVIFGILGLVIMFEIYEVLY